MVAPDLGLADLQLLEVQGQRQQQVAEVLTGEGEGVVGSGLRRRRVQRRGTGRLWRADGERRGWRGQTRTSQASRTTRVGGLDLGGEAVLEAAPGAVDAEPK